MKAFPLIVKPAALVLVMTLASCLHHPSPVIHDGAAKTVTLSSASGDLVLRLDYAGGCSINRIMVNGIEVTGGGNAVFTGIQIDDQIFTSRQSTQEPSIIVRGNTVKIRSLQYGNETFGIGEEWSFTAGGKGIRWTITRNYLNQGLPEDNYFPCWVFNSMNTWDGALMDNGGVAWNRFLGEPGDAYGVSTATLTFWNRAANSCLRVRPVNDGQLFRTAVFSHGKNGGYSAVQNVSAEQAVTRYGLRRFIKTDSRVFAPAAVNPSAITQELDLQALKYDEEYDLGSLEGISEESVIEILNTIGRYGVVDQNLFGSNGWRTGWTVLQEPWLALFGLAIQSPEFIDGFSGALEYARDQAILSDGRVLPRWHHDSTDAMPGTFRPNGFYECQWGYMFDSQPAFAINVAEQFDLTGDLGWLRSFKPVCEKVLDFMIRRDADNDGLFEVVQESHREQKGTDWLDVVWASHEVSTINSFMYLALTRWAELEKLLGDSVMAEKYRMRAAKLKESFNRTIGEGGFWDPGNNCYVHWREPDGTAYGNNLVGPVNFLAIGYGLCDDPGRKKAILGRMEELMQKENLFIWPSCFFPYGENLGLANVNYPWPNYENGDLFLAWAELGTRCYAEENPEIALKYIRNVIRRYETDGLAFQRYTRLSQAGAGDDILSNNIMALVGLYRNIYGIRPQYNRLFLEPHLPAELIGTKLKYRLRGRNYQISYQQGRCTAQTGEWALSSETPFGINAGEEGIEYFQTGEVQPSMRISGREAGQVSILQWGPDHKSWEISSHGRNQQFRHELSGLRPGVDYNITLDSNPFQQIRTDSSGNISFSISIGRQKATVRISG